MTNRKVIITGASGVIGRSCLKPLLDKGFSVIGLYNQSEIDLKKAHPSVDWHQLDLFNPLKRQAFFAEHKASHMLHLAWYAVPKLFWSSPENIKWLQVSLDIFQEFCRHGGRYFTGAGSLTEYDWSYECLDEFKTPLNPGTLYGQCKKSTFEIVSFLQKQYPDVKFSWARIGYFFGENEPSEKLVSSLIKRMMNQEVIKFVEYDTTRDYVHVNYIGSALSELLDRGFSGPINIGGGMPIQLGEMVDFLANKVEHPVSIQYGQYAPPNKEPKVLLPNLNRLHHDLNFSVYKVLWEDLNGLFLSRREGR